MSAPLRLPPRVTVIIEVPRGGVVKRRGDGSLDFVSPLP
jgi:inorganic pyrophosphatase